MLQCICLIKSQTGSFQCYLKWAPPRKIFCESYKVFRRTVFKNSVKELCYQLKKMKVVRYLDQFPPSIPLKVILRLKNSSNEPTVVCCTI